MQLGENCSLLAEIEIRSTMRDMKLMQEESGLGLNNFPCTLCESSKDDIRDPEIIRRGFVINRTNDSLHSAGHYARLNPDNLNREQLGEILKGSKGVPVTIGNSPILNNSFESLHFKLSMARWLKGIIARVNSGLYVWSIDQKLRHTYQPFEDDLNTQLTRVLGIQRRMQLEGNEASKILSTENIPDVVSLVTNIDQQQKMKFLITELAYLNLVIQSQLPKRDHSLVEFSNRAKNLQLFMLDQLNWVVWPPYFHIGLAHTVQILESTDSIAKYSGSKRNYIFQCKCKCIFMKAVSSM